MLITILSTLIGVSASCDRPPCAAQLTISATVAGGVELTTYDTGPGWQLVQVTTTSYETTIERYAVIDVGTGPLVYAVAEWPTRERLAIAVRAARHWLVLAQAFDRWGRVG